MAPALAVLVTCLSLAACGSSQNGGDAVAACRYVAHVNGSGQVPDPVAVAKKLRDLAIGSKVEGTARAMYDRVLGIAGAAKTNDFRTMLKLSQQESSLDDKLTANCSSVGVSIHASLGDGPAFDPKALPMCLQAVGTVYTYEQVVAMTKGCREKPSPQNLQGLRFFGQQPAFCADGSVFAYLPLDRYKPVTRATEVSVAGPRRTGTTTVVPLQTAIDQFEACKAR